MKTCPSCNSINPDTAIVCDCGSQLNGGAPGRDSLHPMERGIPWPTIFVVGLVAGLGILGWNLFIAFKDSRADPGLSSGPVKPTDPAILADAAKGTSSPTPQDRANKVRIMKWSWSKSEIGSVMTASFTLKNENDISVKDIQLTCTLHGKSGTLLNNPIRTIYDQIPPGGTKRFSDINFGFVHDQSSSAQCNVLTVD